MINKIKSKRQKKKVIRRKLKSEDYKNYLKAAQLQNKPPRKKIRIDADSFKEDHKEFIKKTIN